ncbi:hypothetical protein DFH28DRAFT_925792 [Melampsora americana]|nr:hypothetical protein DFH28DRAFT_925792 [Melampsora americana]
MIKRITRIKVTRVRYRIGTRGGILNKSTHRYVDRVYVPKPIILFPVEVINIRNLLIEGVTKGQANQIRDYFDNHRKENHALSRIVQLRIKLLGAARAQVYNPNSRGIRHWRRINLNRLDEGNKMRIQTDQHNCLQITGMENFIVLVDLASRYPNYNQNCKRIVIRGMERNDFEEIISFFVNLKAGVECFPEVRHLVDVSEA